MDQRWGNLSFLLGLLACGAEEDGNAPVVGVGSGMSAGPGSGPITGGTPMTSSSSGDVASSGGGTPTDGASTGAGETAEPVTSGPVETGSETPCGDWAERYIQCVSPAGSVVAAENMCQGAVYDAGGYGAACAFALEERYACLATVECQDLVDWEIDSVPPIECEFEFMQVDLNCPS